MDPFIGEIRLFAGPWAPQDWAFCDGSLLPIPQYDPLFALIGTTYGGDGVNTFGLPDLRGRVPVHRSSTMSLGEIGGSETVTLTGGQVGKHNHGFLAAKDAAAVKSPSLASPAATAGTDSLRLWTAEASLGPFSPAAVKPSAPASQPHENMHPFQAITYIISLSGIFPPHGEEEESS